MLSQYSKKNIHSLALQLIGISVLLLTSAAHAANLRILDDQGKSQSVVELQPDGKASVKVFIRNPDGQPAVGVTVNLMRVEDGQEVQSIASAQTLALGAATFSDVPSGDFRVRVGCSDYQFDYISLQPNEISDSGRETDHVTLHDENGKVLAQAEVDPGGTASLNFGILTPQGTKKTVPVRLVELNNGKESRAAAEVASDSNGQGALYQINSGDYSLRVECQYRMGSVAFSGAAIMKIFCPSLPSAALFMPALGAGGGGIATGSVVASTAITSSEVAAVSAGAVVVGGGVAAGAAVSSSGGKSKPTPIPTAKPTIIPSAVPTRRPTAVPTRAPTSRPTPAATAIPTITIPGLAPTCPPSQQAKARNCRPVPIRKTPAAETVTKDEVDDNRSELSQYR